MDENSTAEARVTVGIASSTAVFAFRTPLEVDLAGSSMSIASFSASPFWFALSGVFSTVFAAPGSSRRALLCSLSSSSELTSRVLLSPVSPGNS